MKKSNSVYGLLTLLCIILTFFFYMRWAQIGLDFGISPIIMDGVYVLYVLLVFCVILWAFGVEKNSDNTKISKAFLKKRILWVIATEMFLVMVCFLKYALNHPEMGIPFGLSLKVIETFYSSYFLLTIGMFLAAIIHKLIEIVKRKRK